MAELWREESATPIDALFEARDTIAELDEITVEQGVQLVELTAQNIALVHLADKVMGGRYGRLSDAVHAIEHFTWRCGEAGLCARPEILVPLLQDAIDYAEAGRLSTLLAWAIRDCARDSARDSEAGRSL